MEPNNTPNKSVAAQMAYQLQHDYIAAIDQTVVSGLKIKPDRLRQFEQKVLLYRLAAVMLALIIEGERTPALENVREELERLIIPTAPDQQVRKWTELGAANDDLSNLLSSDKTGSWAAAWLQAVGIDETNPATLILVGQFWRNFADASRKTVIELGKILQEP